MYANFVLQKFGASLAEATWNLFYDTPSDVELFNELYCLNFLEEGCFDINYQGMLVLFRSLPHSFQLVRAILVRMVQQAVSQRLPSH
jgi:hypothetical protein